MKVGDTVYCFGEPWVILDMEDGPNKFLDLQNRHARMQVHPDHVTVFLPTPAEKKVQGLGAIIQSIALEDLYVMAALAGACARVTAGPDDYGRDFIPSDIAQVAVIAQEAATVGRATYQVMHGQEAVKPCTT